MLINSDGVSEKIYHLLWQPTDISLKTSCDLLIPDTVIFRNNFPVFWYFTNIEGKIKRKAQKNTTKENIFSSFVGKRHGSGVLAYFIYNLDENGKITEQCEPLDLGRNRKELNRTSKIVYFDETKLSKPIFQMDDFYAYLKMSRGLFGQWGIGQWIWDSPGVFGTFFSVK